MDLCIGVETSVHNVSFLVQSFTQVRFYMGFKALICQELLYNDLVTITVGIFRGLRKLTQFWAWDMACNASRVEQIYLYINVTVLGRGNCFLVNKSDITFYISLDIKYQEYHWLIKKNKTFNILQFTIRFCLQCRPCSSWAALMTYIKYL